MKEDLKKEAKDVGLRCAKTFIQTMIGCVSTATMFSQIDFSATMSVCAFATFMCFLMNIYKVLSAKVGDEDE